MEEPWTYESGFISSEYYDQLLPHLEVDCKIHYVTMYGKKFEARKISCMYGDEEDHVDKKSDIGASYSGTPRYLWSEAPKEILEIKRKVEESFRFTPNYVLCHVYRTHTDYLGWHNDREALNSQIVSISLGAERRFRLRPIEDSSGYSREYLMKSGDAIHMIGPRCQHEYKHTLPEMTVKDLVRHLEGLGYVIEGRKTREKCERILLDEGIVIKRINLTFREYEGQSK